MAEQLGLEQRLGQGAAVDGDEGARGAWAVGVDRPGNDLFARTRLAEDEDRQVRDRHARHDAEYVEHEGAAADQVGELRRRVGHLCLADVLSPLGGRARQALQIVHGERLADVVARAVADPSLEHSGIAILVVSLDRGDTLFAREPDRLYTPASNRKLFTAASALHWLGPDYRFTSALLATAPVSDDTLRGDLVLVGHGDPDLTVVHLAALADSLAAVGVRVVTGDVRADASWFDDVEWGAGWMWDDGPYWEWPYITALTIAVHSSASGRVQTGWPARRYQ